MTFQAYQRSRRLSRALHEIRAGADPTRVGLRHGYESTSGFRDAFKQTFRATPGRATDRDCLRTAMLESPLGPLLAGATEKAICLLEFTERRALERQMAALRRRFDSPVVPGENRPLSQLRTELAEYFAGKRRRFTVPLAFPGSEFQVAVWKRLLEIPYGQTLSYEQMAIDLGRRGAQRAVGRANGENRIAILVPCHRVVNKNGELGGYGGGLWRKQFLLDLEQGRRQLLAT